MTQEVADWWLSLHRGASCLISLVSARAEHLCLHPSDVTENFLIKIADETQLWGISKKAGGSQNSMNWTKK